jgi:winged helix-turn-helix protein
VVRRWFGVVYTLAGLDQLLHRIGWSVQFPVRQLVIQVSDPEAEICWITPATVGLHDWTAPGALTVCPVLPTLPPPSPTPPLLLPGASSCWVVGDLV